MKFLRPAVFLDRDATLVRSSGDPALVHLLAGARAGAHALRAAGYALVVADRSGATHGLLAPTTLAALRARLESLLGLPIAGVYGPQPPGAGLAADCLLRRAADELGLDLRRSWLVGDRMDDLVAGSRAGGLPALLVHQPHGHPTIVARGLDDAAYGILAANDAPRRSALVQVPVTITPRLRATTITAATLDLPANKAPAIAHTWDPTLELSTIDALVRLRRACHTYPRPSPGAAPCTDHDRAGADILRTPRMAQQLATTLGLHPGGLMPTNVDPFEGVTRLFMAKYLNSAALRGALARLPAARLSRLEIGQITDFYRRALGRRAVEEFARLMIAGARIRPAMIHESMPVLQYMVRAQIERTLAAAPPGPRHHNPRSTCPAPIA